MKPLTRRGLFGLIGAAAAGRLVPVTPPPVAPTAQTIKVITEIDGRAIARQVIKYLPDELRLTGSMR